MNTIIIHSSNGFQVKIPSMTLTGLNLEIASKAVLSRLEESKDD